MEKIIEEIIWFAYIVLMLGAVSTVIWLIGHGIWVFWEEYKRTFNETARTNMEDMFMFVDAKKLFSFYVGGIFAIPLIVLLITREWILVLPGLIAAVVLPWLIYQTIRTRRLKKFEKQLPDAFIMLSGSLQAGASLSSALEGLVQEQPAPLSQEFELLVRQQRMGVDLDMALTNMEQRLPIPDFIVAISSIKISREVGGNLVEVMDTMAKTLRKKADMEGKIESLTAQGKLQGIVMTMLPLLLGAVLMKIEPVAMGKMFTTPVGWGVLSVIIVMELLGYMTIRKITSIDV